MDLENLKEYLNKLNPEQKKAATLDGGSALVLAAAGSGKTSTLICRIAYLVGEKGFQPHQILAVTFTNKASREMSSRLWKMGMDTKSLWIGTFHGICNKILRYHTQEAGLRKGFYIMDSQEQGAFLKRAIRSNGYDPKSINLDDLQHKINNYKEAGWRSNQLKLNSQERKFYEIYENACKQDNCVDFGELMFGCYELFQNHPEIANSYSEKFHHILVDEFQDTSELQYKWLKVLGKTHGNVFAVGDDDQCLPEGTLVKTSLGDKKIEDIQVGEKVLSSNGVKTVEKTVIDKFSKNYKGELIKLTMDNKSIVSSTHEHTWFAELRDPKYIPKETIVITLCNDNEEDVAIHSLEYVTDISKNKEILLFSGFKSETVEQDIMFKLLICSNDYGSLMEQANKLQYLLGHPKLIQQAKINGNKIQQVKASDITCGMIMIDAMGKKLLVKNVECISIKTKIYDLNIDNTHNFFANGIATHNSIYGWRGAKPENLNIFLKDFNAQIIKVEKNYRSDANILEAANAVIKNNTNRQGKNLVPTKPAKKLINLYSAFNDEQESSFVANEIKKMRRNSVPYREMAILYRTNGQSRSLEKALNAQNIPYVVYGGFRFFDRQEVKHAMAYLRLAHNPNDNIAFLRVANIPARAIGDTALQKLDAQANENSCSLYEMAKKGDAKTLKKFEPFIEKIEIIKKYCTNKNLPDMVRTVIVDSGLETMYENDKKDGEERLDNLYELISAAEVFMQENDYPNIDEFLAFSTLETDIQTNKRDDSADVVKLMTVHSSKGLEFNVVFVTGMEENLFPHANSQGDLTLIEEERRLMYVALTRARDDLYITCSEERLIHGQRNRYIKSRFLREIPTKLFLKLN